MKVRLLLSTQRSGSHFLKAYIESRFPTVICSGEVLEEPIAIPRQLPALSSHPDFPHFWLWYQLEAGAQSISVAPDRRIEGFELYLSKLAALAAPKDLVIDAKYNNLRALSGYWDTDHGSNDFAAFVTNRQIPVLHLIRKNILRVIVSHKLAEATGIWHRTKERPTEEIMPKIHLNPANVISYIQYAQQLTEDYQGLFSGNPNYEEIAYEDLVREKDFPHIGPGLRTIAHFLGKKAGAPQHAALPFKTTPEDPAEVVENWDEIHRALQGTVYGWMVQAPFLAAA